MAAPAPQPSNKELEARLAHLPPQLKLKLMGLISPGNVADSAAAYETSTSEMLPRVAMRPLILHPEYLSQWNEKQLLALDEPGYFLVDNFMGAGHAEKVRAEGQRLLEFGALRPAQMASGNAQWKEGALRGDKIMWLNQRDTYDAMAPATFAVIDRMTAMREELNKVGPFESSHSQVQLACYDGGGARYVRHLDATKKGAARRLTLLYYANVGWMPEHGGCLRLYLPSGPVDIEPRADRLLVFQSRVLEHEVLPSFAQRFSLTMWYY